MKRLLTLISGMLLLMCSVFAWLPAAHAYEPLGSACSGVSGSPTCQTGQGRTTNPLTGTNGTLTKVANIIAVLAGTAAIIVMIWAGIQYITANGDPQKAAAARKTVIGAVVGIIIIVLARVMVSLVALSLR